MDRRLSALLALVAVAACNLTRERPHTTPTSATSAGVGGDWPFSSTTTTHPTTSAGPQPDHCYCIYASAHVDACVNCASLINVQKCDAEWQACQADANCKALVQYCVAAAANDGGMIDTCLGQPGSTRDLLEAYYGCLCTVVACTQECEGTKQCADAGTSSTTSSASSTGASSSSSAASTTSSGTGGAGGAGGAMASSSTG